MAATLTDIRDWFTRGKQEGATHMIVVCDTFDWEDYPVYVKKDEDVNKKLAEYREKGMQRIMEVYSFAKTWEEQATGRVWNI